MNLSRNCPLRILSALAGLVLVAAPLMVGVAWADPDDIAAYQAYTSQRAYPPPATYARSLAPAQRNELQARLSYAEAQYEQARQVGNQGAAKHWRKQIKHLSRELYGERHAEGQGYSGPAMVPPGGAPYGPPPPAFYGPPAQPYAAPSYGQMPYPPSGYTAAGYASGYPPAGYPATGYPYGAPAASGSMGGLSSLLGPLMGGGAAPSAATYPGYPQAPNGATSSPFGASGGIVSLLGPLLGAAPVR